MVKNNSLMLERVKEVYFGPFQGSTMELFNKNNYQLKAVNYFCKKYPS